jgi:hypothetical protein
MKLAETDMDLSLDYQYVPVDNKLIVAFATGEPGSPEAWDQRFALSGTTQEITEMCLELLHLMHGDSSEEDAEAAQDVSHSECRCCHVTMKTK